MRIEYDVIYFLNRRKKHSGDNSDSKKHVAFNKTTSGHNHYLNNSTQTVHAEMDFKNNYLRINKGVHRPYVDHLIVARDGNSKPCANCIHSLNINLNIRKISYTDNNGELITVTFSKLVQEMNNGEAYVSRGDRIGEIGEDDEESDKPQRFIL